MDQVRDRTFNEGEMVETDGKHFSKCHFDGVQLRYSGGQLPGFEDCTFAAVGWFVSAPESHADNTRLESSTNALVVASPSTMEFEKLHRGSQNPRHRSNTRPVGWSQP